MSEFAALALSGLLDMVGSPDREPLRLGGHQAAYAAGMSAFTAMCALAVGRDLGLWADSARVSMVETALWINWKAMAAAQASGRANSRKGAQAEFQVLRCLDGWVALVFAPTQFDAVIALVGDPALTQPQFQTVSGRAAHRTELFEVLGPWFAQRRVLDIYSQGQALGVPLGPVLDAADLLDDPQYLAREFITTLPHATLGELKMPRLPVLWGDRIPRPLARTDASLETLVSELNRA